MPSPTHPGSSRLAFGHGCGRESPLPGWVGGACGNLSPPQGAAEPRVRARPQPHLPGWPTLGRDTRNHHSQRKHKLTMLTKSSSDGRTTTPDGNWETGRSLPNARAGRHDGGGHARRQTVNTQGTQTASTQSLGFYFYSPLTYSSRMDAGPEHLALCTAAGPLGRLAAQHSGRRRLPGRTAWRSLQDEAWLVRRQPGWGSLRESRRVRRHELCGESGLWREAPAGRQGRAL